jgi:hypothetical protein
MEGLENKNKKKVWPFIVLAIGLIAIILFVLIFLKPGEKTGEEYKMREITLKFNITLIGKAMVTSLEAGSSSRNQDELRELKAGDLIKGEIKTMVPPSDMISKIHLEGSGDPNSAVQFNFEYKGKKLFAEEVKEVLNSNGQFSFSKLNIPLPE